MKFLSVSIILPGVNNKSGCLESNFDIRFQSLAIGDESIIFWWIVLLKSDRLGLVLIGGICKSNWFNLGYWLN